jgi:hypothetical protein
MDKANDQKNCFLTNSSGDASKQFALIAGAVSIATALLVPLVFKGNSQIASTDTYGVDRTVTGSIKPVKRYHIRKSILDKSN